MSRAAPSPSPGASPIPIAGGSSGIIWVGGPHQNPCFQPLRSLVPALGSPGGTSPGYQCPPPARGASSAPLRRRSPARRCRETEARGLRGRGVHPLRPPGPAGPAPAPPAAFPPPRTLLRRESVSCRCRRPHSALAPGERPQADMGPRSVPLLPLLLALLGRSGEWGRGEPGNRPSGDETRGTGQRDGAPGTRTAPERGVTRPCLRIGGQRGPGRALTGRDCHPQERRFGEQPRYGKGQTHRDSRNTQSTALPLPGTPEIPAASLGRLREVLKTPWLSLGQDEIWGVWGGFGGFPSPRTMEGLTRSCGREMEKNPLKLHMGCGAGAGGKKWEQKKPT